MFGRAIVEHGLASRLYLATAVSDHFTEGAGPVSRVITERKSERERESERWATSSGRHNHHRNAMIGHVVDSSRMCGLFVPL